MAGAFRAFYQRFAPRLGPNEARRHGEQYGRGLLVQWAERRNAENRAEAVVGGASAGSGDALRLDNKPHPVIERDGEVLGEFATDQRLISQGGHHDGECCQCSDFDGPQIVWCKDR